MGEYSRQITHPCVCVCLRAMLCTVWYGVDVFVMCLQLYGVDGFVMCLQLHVCNMCVR